MSPLAAASSPIRRPQGSLDPDGPAAEEIADLWWVLVAIGGAVFVLVVVLLVVGILRRRRGGAPREGDRDEVSNAVVTRWLVGGGVVLPAVILAATLLLSVDTMGTIRHTAPDESVVIDVVGHQWWWSAHYPGTDVTVANEIHIPAGEPVELRLTSADVIHSFWVPGLHGKLDLLPDGINTLVIEATEPGEYSGDCAEFCGLQHAKMGVLVIAHTPDEFAAWLADQQQPAVAPATDEAARGQEVFSGARCANCHTVRGVSTATEPGPDLTHLASRRTLAADTIENTREELTRWLHDPSSVKEGTAMPPPRLTDEELTALVAYLESLD